MTMSSARRALETQTTTRSNQSGLGQPKSAHLPVLPEFLHGLGPEQTSLGHRVGTLVDNLTILKRLGEGR
jgi:hypothetical protein